MQNVKETIEFFVKALEFFGINDINKEDVRKAKHNESNELQVQSLKNTVFKLCILYLCEFNINIKDIKLEIKQQDLFLHIFFFNLQCPFITDYELFFSKGRDIMIAIGKQNLYQCYYQAKISLIEANQLVIFFIGWLTNEIEFFDQYRQKSIEQVQLKIDQIQKVHFKGKATKPMKCQKDLMQNFNQIIFKFRRLENLSHLLEKKFINFQEKLQKQNVQSKVNEFLLFLNEEALQQKMIQMKEMLNLLDLHINGYKHEEVFWAWMESLVDSDKKEMQHHPNYDFIKQEDEQEDRSQLQQDDLIHELNNLNSLYAEKSEQFDLFNKNWKKECQLIQNSQQAIDSLNMNSEKIILQVDQRYLKYDQFCQILQQESPNKQFNLILTQFREGLSEFKLKKDNQLNDDNIKNQIQESLQIQINIDAANQEIINRIKTFVQQTITIYPQIS